MCIRDSNSTIQSALCWLTQSFSAYSNSIRAQSGEYCGSSPVYQPVYSRNNISTLNITTVIVPVYFLPDRTILTDNLATIVQTNTGIPGWNQAFKNAVSSVVSVDTFTALTPATPVVPSPNVTNASASNLLTLTLNLSLIHI
eukprot:TRINITY_DN11568_c0_g1_i1.p1 TRINITY_DN11568_c0_g1~~TRINITY_DN11568_c0_g1_i1.p1  ORF type:complete len:162 (-),score=38.05 TRINITY_DN11568_c0_g1_i1:61-486(-)